MIKKLFFSPIVALFFSITLFGHFAESKVWQATNVWNEEWESRFSNWVENDLALNIFIAGKYNGVVSDCTDAAYIIRLIFSYENSLPYKIFRADGGFLTNDTSAFDSFAEGLPRLKRMIAFVADQVASGSVFRDTYPIQINRTFLRPGVVEVHQPAPGQGGSGHAQMVKAVKENGVIGFIWNSVPPAARLLALTYTITYVPRPDVPKAGFRRWIWPQDFGKDPSTLPGYSLEQYELGILPNGQTSLEKYTQALLARLKLREVTKEEVFDQSISTICSMIRLRVEVVNGAEELKTRKGNRCFNAIEYEDFSTPSRDSRLTTAYLDFFWQFAVRISEERFEAKEVELAINRACPMTEFDSRHTITTFDFLAFLSNNIASSNPNDTYWKRWGYTDRNSDCPKY